MILSITLDRKKGGIANSLISYSKALDLIGEKHFIILPKDAAAKDDLLNLPNVQIFSIEKSLLYFHLLTRFIFKPKDSDNCSNPCGITILVDSLSG